MNAHAEDIESSDGDDEEERALFARMAEREHAQGGSTSSSAQPGRRGVMRKVAVQATEIIDLLD